MTPFRSATSIFDAEAATLHATRLAELAATPRGHRSIHVRRTARIAAGRTGAVAAAVIAMCMIADTGHYGALILIGWAFAIAAYAVAAITAATRLRRRLEAAVTRTGDPFTDLDALGAEGPAAIEHAMASENGHASGGWPLIAAMLLGPHTIHMAVAAVVNPTLVLVELDEWIRGSALITIPVFAWAVVAAWRYPRRRKALVDLAIGVLIALVPGVMIAGIPSLFVLATGLVLLLVAVLPIALILDTEELTLAQRAGALGAD